MPKGRRLKGEKQMTKLKTLKDMGEDECGFGNEHIDRNELKAEAIKWVNVHRDKMWNWTEDTWRSFFNITEEDLKETEK